MWELEKTDEFDRCAKWFIKKRPKEFQAVLDNLDTLHKALIAGMTSAQVHTFGFVHSEPMGILAVDQKGAKGGGKLAQTRLYVYPDYETCILHMIKIGDKASQSADIKFCRQFVKSFLESKRETKNDPKESLQERSGDDSGDS